MNLPEAGRLQIVRVRKPYWADPSAYLKLNVSPDGYVGMSARLFEETTQLNVLNMQPGSQEIVFYQGFASFGDDWEEYTGEPSKYEAEYED